MRSDDWKCPKSPLAPTDFSTQQHCFYLHLGLAGICTALVVN